MNPIDHKWRAYFFVNHVGIARIDRRTWKDALLNDLDTIIIDGTVRKLKAKYLGAGVYEISVNNPDKD